jgi:hypothetical protein
MHVQFFAKIGINDAIQCSNNKAREKFTGFVVTYQSTLKTSRYYQRNESLPPVLPVLLLPVVAEVILPVSLLFSPDVSLVLGVLIAVVSVVVPVPALPVPVLSFVPPGLVVESVEEIFDVLLSPHEIAAKARNAEKRVRFILISYPHGVAFQFFYHA